MLVREVSAEQLPLLLAQDIAQRLQHAISQKGSAVLSVSGGSSPIALFHALRVTAIDWAKVTITLVDERYVPTSDPQSNAYLVRSHLSQQNAERARFIPLIDNAHAPLPPLQEMVAKANYRMLGIAVADVLVLGMGADGHTASLFSHAPNFDDALDLRQSNAYIGIELPADTFNAGASVVPLALAKHCAKCFPRSILRYPSQVVKNV